MKKETPMARKYGKGASKAVKKEMHRFKRGTAHSGRGHAKVKSRKQAIAIALSEARKKGVKVPKKKRKQSCLIKLAEKQIKVGLF